MKGLISVIVVNYNALKYLAPCFESLLEIDNNGYALEIIMVDNLSQDRSVSVIRDKFPEIKIIENDRNNYTKALNLGIRSSVGNYVAFLNPDTIVEKNWLTGILDIMSRHDRIGVVQSKILFFDKKTINSVGVEDTGDFYFHDIGFNEEDVEQYSNPAEINYFSGGSVFFRRDCLVEVGSFDEDFVMYMEDIDYSIRCRNKGWRLFYSPQSIVYHKYHGVTSSVLCEYYCSRNRLLLLGKYFPCKLSDCIKTSHFYLKNDTGNLFHSLIQALKIMAEYQPTEIIVKVLDDLKDIILGIFGSQKAVNFFSQLEVVLDLRKNKGRNL